LKSSKLLKVGSAASVSLAWQGYASVSFALMIPIIMWPLSLYFGLQPSMGVNIAQNWAVSAACLLLTATVADSLLAYQQRFLDVMVGLIWILLISYVVTFVLQHLNTIWLLAVCFVLRAVWRLPGLWRHGCSGAWWHWMAWTRDSAAAFLMFFWLYQWPN